jgi:hypothetical protein
VAPHACARVAPHGLLLRGCVLCVSLTRSAITAEVGRVALAHAGVLIAVAACRAATLTRITQGGWRHNTRTEERREIEPHTRDITAIIVHARRALSLRACFLTIQQRESEAARPCPSRGDDAPGNHRCECLRSCDRRVEEVWAAIRSITRRKEGGIRIERL